MHSTTSQINELLNEYENIVLNEAAQCTKVTQKTSSDRDNKKWMKCAKDSKTGKIKRVHWGDPNAKVTGKSGNTDRKKSFRARHDCKNATNPATAKYQACKDW